MLPLTAKIKISEEHQMAAYVCEKCGMSIGTMTCGKCSKELVHSTLTTDDGTKVHISQCPPTLAVCSGLVKDSWSVGDLC